jgi:chromosome segregation protein
MRIKKIYMTGFKSFMDRLEVGFPSGLSAIVGPNGCGKSNIVDAIRWAMGEQSAKLLRGRQMEDVIFGGADEFKPLGMAEVSITFENGNGSFPAEFTDRSEISVTRRLYRSGESEYLLNNVSCRLKDIQEIFMDTGLGNRAYSIIGQGKIGSIIEQRPEETRAMLEEAAGITKYKKKVEESRRKIDLTKGNLQRVEDILMEVERQMRYLKRQAAQARRFKAIGQEIQRLELMLNANSYHELKEESGSRMRSTEDLVQEEILRSTTFSGIQARIETMNLDLEEKDKEISGLRETYLQWKERVNKKESTLESMAAEKRMQVELETRLVKEKEDLGRRLRELQEERNTLTEKIEKVKQSSADLEDEVSLAQQRVKGRHELLKEVKEAYEEARTRVNSGMSREMSLTQESGYLSKRIAEITDSRSRLEREKGDVSQKIENIVRGSRRKQEVREALSHKLEAIEMDMAGEKLLMEDLEQKRGGLETDLKSIEADLNTSQTRLTTLRSLTDNFEGYKIGVRTIMKARDLEARREGRILGLVADIIQVEPRFEQAVEAVLADKLQYIIVESQKDGREAVDYLKTRAKGRSSFVPLSELNGKEGYGKHNGFPLLRDLVTAPDSYRALIDLLLGNAALVEDLEQAVSAWANNGKDQCLVTPDGDMVDRAGIISGGKAAHTSHGILARKREIKNLTEKVARLEEQREVSLEELKKVNSGIDSRKAVIEDLAEEKMSCQDKINDLDKANFQLSHELDQLEKLSERITAELDSKDREQNKHRDALSKITSELELCKERRRQEEDYFSEKELELKESEEEFEQYRDELANLKTAHSLSCEEERGLLREVERIDDFAYEAEKTFKRIEEDIAGAKTRYRQYLESEETLRGELKDLHVTLEQAEDALNRTEQDRNQFRYAIREEENKGEVLRGEIEHLRERIHTARMEQSELGFKMNGLVGIVKEKFDLDLTEIYKDYLEEGFSPLETKAQLDRQKVFRERLGEVNLTAIQEHEALKERHSFITGQREDLLQSIDSLSQAIRKINRTSLEKFMKTFAEVDEKLKEVFPILFNGGTAGLRLIDETMPLECGVLVEVRPPGKKLSHMGLLSGGEKALVAMALIFAIYLIKPSPFCLLDEVDAPLDEANIDRFNDLLRKIIRHSQVILVTHNRRSMEIADRLYGVTMEKKGVSKLVSVNLSGFRNN